MDKQRNGALKGQFTDQHNLDIGGESVNQKTYTNNSTQVRSSKYYIILKTINLFFLFMCLALCIQVIGPSLGDLTDRVGVDYEQISRALIGQSIGVISGAIIGGILYDRIPRRHSDVFIIAGFTVVALGTIAIPWLNSLYLVSSMFFITGLAKGIIDIAGNTMVINLWGVETAAPMHALHFGYGVGSVITPQIVWPFLSPQTEEELTTISPTSTATICNQTAPPEDSNIEIAYAISGVTTLLVTCVFSVLYIKGPPEGFSHCDTTPLSPSMCSPRLCGRGQPNKAVVLLVFLFFYFFHAVGGEVAYALFLFSYLTEKDNNLSNSQAGLLNSLYFATYTMGRGLGTLCAKFVSTDTMIIVDCVATIITALVLALFAYGSNVILWIFTLLMGLCVSIMFPCGISWANLHLNMNSLAMMVLLFGSNFGALAYQYTTGFLFENNGPRILMYTMVFFAFLHVVNYACMLITTKVVGKKRVVPSLSEHLDHFDTEL